MGPRRERRNDRRLSQLANVFHAFATAEIASAGASADLFRADLFVPPVNDPFRSAADDAADFFPLLILLLPYMFGGKV